MFAGRRSSNATTLKIVLLRMFNFILNYVTYAKKKVFLLFATGGWDPHQRERRFTGNNPKASYQWAIFTFKKSVIIMSGYSKADRFIREIYEKFAKIDISIRKKFRKNYKSLWKFAVVLSFFLFLLHFISTMHHFNYVSSSSCSF